MPPQKYQLPVPESFRTPRITDLPMHKYYQKQFESGAYKSMLKTQQGRQNETVQQNTVLWQAGKMKDQDYLSGFDQLISNATNPVDVRKYEVGKQVAESSILMKKFDAQYDRIKGDYAAGKLTAKEAYNKMTQLSIQSATAGNEAASAKYYLDAETFLELETRPKKTGISSTDARNNVINAISDAFLGG